MHVKMCMVPGIGLSETVSMASGKAAQRRTVK